jgi:hypothetical protein
MLALLGAAAPAAAQNLVVNGDFDPAQGVTSWVPGPMTVLQWIAADWQGDPASGSGHFTNVAPCAGTVASQCIALLPPHAASFELGAAVFLESLPIDASARVAVLALDGTSCAGTVVGFSNGPSANVQGQWDSFLTTDIPLPASTQSVSIQLTVTKPFLPGCPATPPVSARFDHVRFGPTGTTPVTLQSLSVE